MERGGARARTSQRASSLRRARVAHHAAGCSRIRSTAPPAATRSTAAASTGARRPIRSGRSLAAWVRGRGAPCRRPRPTPPGTAVRIIQTNAAGDGAHLIDPGDQPRHRRAAAASRSRTASPRRPTARGCISSNEVRHTLDVVDAEDAGRDRAHPAQRPPEQRQHHEGRPQGLRGHSRRHPGALDVIDTVALKNVKTVPTKGGIHNVYVTPDSSSRWPARFRERTISIVDTATDTLARTIPMSAGIRPMAFTTNPDGSTQDDRRAALRLPRVRHGGLRHREGDGARRAPGRSRASIRTPTACRARRRTAWRCRPTARGCGPRARSTATPTCTACPT